MESPSRPESSPVTKKVASCPSTDDFSKQPTASTFPISNYRLGTAAMMLPNSSPPTPEHVLNSEGNNHAVKAAEAKEVPPGPSAKLPKKTPVKRPRTNSNSSSIASDGAATTPAKKRVRTTALMRTAPRANSDATLGGLAGNSEFMNFTATIFIIQLGPDGAQFHAHESVLKRSPKLAEEIDKAKANKRATKQNTMVLMSHDAIAFEQMLQFLYKDKFVLCKTKTTPDERLAEFKELMSLAKHYVLPVLQKQVVKLFAGSKILSKVQPGRFFDWADDMYHEELDHEHGAFKEYFAKVAPMLMKGMDVATQKELALMVSAGGGFAEQLFIATLVALDTQEKRAAVKKEEVSENSTPVHPRVTKAKGKEPVRQNVREGAKNTPGDDSMEDNSDGLFVHQ